jgi:hypothetical protein
MKKFAFHNLQTATIQLDIEQPPSNLDEPLPEVPFYNLPPSPPNPKQIMF